LKIINMQITTIEAGALAKLQLFCKPLAFERWLVWACKCAAMCGGFIKVAVFLFVFKSGYKLSPERFCNLAANGGNMA
jgi:hypothetical protein